MFDITPISSRDEAEPAAPADGELPHMVPDFIAHPAHGIGALTPDHKRRYRGTFLSFDPHRISLPSPRLDDATMADVVLGRRASSSASGAPVM